MLTKRIRFFGAEQNLSCDGRCDKAFGINGRPRIMFSADPDDHVFKGDSEVGTAPPPGQTVGIAEGECLKPSATPLSDPAVMNKWCVRECERSALTSLDEPIELPNMDAPTPNLAARRDANGARP